MKFIESEQTPYGEKPVLELTRRNLETLLVKLGMEGSACSLMDPDRLIMVRAVEDSEHYKTRAAGAVLINGELK